MRTINRRTALKTATAAIAAVLFSPTIRPARLAAAELVETIWIVRTGETVRLQPGRYRRVILEGGRLEAPNDVCIEELEFHSGAIAMPVRMALKA